MIPLKKRLITYSAADSNKTKMLDKINFNILGVRLLLRNNTQIMKLTERVREETSPMMNINKE